MVLGVHVEPDAGVAEVVGDPHARARRCRSASPRPGRRSARFTWPSLRGRRPGSVVVARAIAGRGGRASSRRARARARCPPGRARRASSPSSCQSAPAVAASCARGLVERARRAQLPRRCGLSPAARPAHQLERVRLVVAGERARGRRPARAPSARTGSTSGARPRRDRRSRSGTRGRFGAAILDTVSAPWVKEGQDDQSGRPPSPRAGAARQSWTTNRAASAFLDRMGVLGDWIVDWAFGDVHTRPGLTARERELIIVAVLDRARLERPAGRARTSGPCAPSTCPGTRSRRRSCRLRRTLGSPER